MAQFKEYSLKTTAFNEPKVYKDYEALQVLITRLILLEPGTNNLHPTMGIGIRSKFRYLVSSTMESELKTRVENQISTFIPECQVADVSLIKNDDKTVDIRVEANGMLFVYDSSENVPIELSDLKNL